MLINVASLEELKCMIQKDQKEAHRYATRFILVKAADEWNRLLLYLKECCAETSVYASTFCSTKDAEPVACQILNRIIQGNGHILVLPLGELIRLRGVEQYEALLTELIRVENNMEHKEQCIGRRIYIPMFCSESIFHEVTDGISAWYMREQAADAWNLTTVGNNPCSLTIIDEQIPVNSDYIPIFHLKDYLEAWEQKALLKAILKSPFIACFQPVNTGGYDIQIFQNSYVMLANKFAELKDFPYETFNESDWNKLQDKIGTSSILIDSLLHLLRLDTPDCRELLNLWNRSDAFEKSAVWLCLKLLARSDQLKNRYLESVLNRSLLPRDFIGVVERTIYNMLDMSEVELLKLHNHRKELLDQLLIDELSSSAWENWSSLQPVNQLRALSFHTKREKCEGIKLLFQVENHTLYDVYIRQDIEVLFPQLRAYLTPIYDQPEWITAYFDQYRADKLRDQISSKLREMVALWPEKRFEQKPRTDCIIDENDVETTIHYWDCVGGEWMPMIKHRVEQMDSSLEAVTSYVRAVWPTITEINKLGDQINVEHFTEKPMDELIHTPMDYPAYIVEEFEVVDKIVSNAVRQMQSKSRVLISSDHGASRMVVLDRNKTIPVPLKATPKYFGRYAECEIPYETSEWIIANNCMVNIGYQRFSSSGNCGCENHGGATPEETLVPFIIVQKACLRITDYSKIAKKFKNQSLSWQATFNKAVDCASILVSGRIMEGHCMHGNTWDFDISELETSKSYTFEIQATLPCDGMKKVQEIDVFVQSGLAQNPMKI